MTKLSTQCGDWHLGWGYGGHDKIGKLSLDPETMIFTWKGSSQGRHGQKWNSGANCSFTYTPEKGLYMISSKGGYPKPSELIKSANELLNKLS